MNHRASQRRRFLIVHNASAGRRRRDTLDQVCARLVAAGALVTVEQADCAETDRSVVTEARHSGRFDAIVAAGGDSTIRGVASGLVGTDLPLGIVPIGTGNVLAEEIGLGRTPDAIAACLLAGPIIAVTPGLAGDELFLAMAGAGFDARVLKRLDTGWKQRVGKLAYGGPILGELAHRPRRFRAVLDGREVSCTWLIVTKAAHYAGSFIIAPRQRLTALDFHAMVVTAETRRAMAGVLAAIPMGLARRHPLVELVSCCEVELPPGQDVPVQIDGEAIGSTPMKIRSSGANLRLIVPEIF